METLKHHSLRITASAVCFVMAGVVIWTSHAGSVDVIFSMAFAAPFALAGAIFITPLLLELLAAPMDALLFPGARFDGPQPMYSIPASKRAKGLYDEAIAGYEKIANDYPAELKPYVEMISIAIMNLRDEARARQILRQAFTVFTKTEDRNILQQMFDDNVRRLQATPEWFDRQAERSLVPPDLKNEGPVDEPDGHLHRRFHTGGEGTYLEPGVERRAERRRMIAYGKTGIIDPGVPVDRGGGNIERTPDVSDPSSGGFSLGKISHLTEPQAGSPFDLEKVMPILNSISILGGLDEAQIRKVLSKMEKVSYPAGGRIFTAGEPSSKIYVISSGRVRIVAEENGKSVELAQYPVGQCFGESSAIGILRHSATAEVLETTELMVLSAKNLHALFHEDPSLFGLLILNIAREACRRLHNSNQLVLHYASGKN